MCMYICLDVSRREGKREEKRREKRRRKKRTDPFTFIDIDPVCVCRWGEVFFSPLFSSSSSASSYAIVRSFVRFFPSQLPWTNRQAAAVADAALLNVINLGGATFVRLLVLYRKPSFFLICEMMCVQNCSNKFLRQRIRAWKRFLPNLPREIFLGDDRGEIFSLIAIDTNEDEDESMLNGSIFTRLVALLVVSDWSSTDDQSSAANERSFLLVLHSAAASSFYPTDPANHSVALASSNFRFRWLIR